MDLAEYANLPDDLWYATIKVEAFDGKELQLLWEQEVACNVPIQDAYCVFGPYSFTLEVYETPEGQIDQQQPHLMEMN